MAESTVRPVDLAIVGCGAITELGHAPGAKLASAVRLRIVVDVDLERAKRVGQMYGVDDVRSTVDGIEDAVEAVVVALPHHLHRDFGVRLLDRGLHVLMEKPLARDVTECEALAVCAKRNERVLAVAMLRRYTAANVQIKKIIDAKTFGSVQSFSIQEGDLFSWPIRTPFLLKEGNGEGVIMGNGSHVFDLVRWLLGDVREFDCEVPENAGPVADATIKLTLASGAHGEITLSRIRRLNNGMRINFERASIDIPQYGDRLTIWTPDGRPMMTAQAATVGEYATSSSSLPELMAAQLSNFADSIRLGREPEVGADAATEVLRLVERCAATVHRKPQAWRRSIFVP